MSVRASRAFRVRIGVPRQSRPRMTGASGSRSRSISFRVRDDDVRRLLANHVDGADDEQPGGPREDRGVDDAQALGVVDLEVAGQARRRGPSVRSRRCTTRDAPTPDRARTSAASSSVLVPGPRAHLVRRPRRPSSGAVSRRTSLHAARRPHCRSSPAGISAFVEVAEVDAGVSRGFAERKRHRAAGIVGVRLEHHPRQADVRRLEDTSE